MRGKGLSKTIFGGLDFVELINYDDNDVSLNESYKFTKDDVGKLFGCGVLVCYSGDLNDLLIKFREEPLWYTIIDGILCRFILPCGVAALHITDVVTFESINKDNWVNAFNNGLDIIHIRRNFDKLADSNLFKDTLLPVEVYTSLKTLFHGGVMNAIPGVYENVKSYDLVSAHASNIINETYPLGCFVRSYMNINDLMYCRKSKDIFFVGNITLKNLRLKPNFIGIIYMSPESIMFGSNIVISESGYVIEASEIRIPITEIYFECITMCYDFDGIEDEFLFLCTESGKLPNNIREYVLDKYNIKKNMPHDTPSYKEAKLLVNLCYGFLCRSTLDYEHYAYSHKLVYPYQWGVYTCLYTTLKIVTAMNEVVSRGGIPVALATDSIKYVGDFDLNGGDSLGKLKFEHLYKNAYIVSVYRAIYKKEDDSLEVKLAGCIKDKSEKYFMNNSPVDILMNYTVIPDGKVFYRYNSENFKFEPEYCDFTISEIAE